MKSVQWLIEHMGHTDDNDVALLKVLESTGRLHLEIKQIPFTEELIGFDQIDRNLPALAYGSVQIIEKIAKRPNLNVTTFWGDGWFDPRNWCGKRSDLLNEQVREATVSELRENWVDEPTFVKSIGVKKLNGMVIEPDKADRDNWRIEHSVLDPEDVLVLSPVIRIDREYRFFVVDGEVVTGSTYRKDGYKSIRHPVSEAAWFAARRAVQGWMPGPTLTIDLARTRAGEYKIVEWNCIQSSGFYSSDIGKIIDALETQVKP